VKALIKTARDESSCLQILEAVEAVNDAQKHRMFQKLTQALGGDLRGARVAVWGLAFKPNTDDLREAPSLTLIDELLAAGASVAAHDPVAMVEAKHRFGDRVSFASSSYDALESADALAVVTDWNEYRHPDFARIKHALRRPIIVDGRNLYALNRMMSMGFSYHSIGRPAVA
jgi:UDPglucose 6-dehydrogenase